jgi:hypothetical protein
VLTATAPQQGGLHIEIGFPPDHGGQG